MPCKIMLLGVFGAKIIRIYIHSKQFTIFMVSNFDAIINIKLTNQHAFITQNIHLQPYEISKIGNLYNKIVVKRSGIINHFIPYIQI